MPAKEKTETKKRKPQPKTKSARNPNDDQIKLNTDTKYIIESKKLLH